MAKESEDLLRGTLDALILKTLTWGPRHGYGIAGWIKETSRDTLAVEDRALRGMDGPAPDAILR